MFHLSPVFSLDTVNFGERTTMPPKYAGLSGRKLSLTLSTIATMGFLLFGYDRKFHVRG